MTIENRACISRIVDRYYQRKKGTHATRKRGTSVTTIRVSCKYGDISKNVLSSRAAAAKIVVATTHVSLRVSLLNPVDRDVSPFLETGMEGTTPVNKSRNNYVLLRRVVYQMKFIRDSPGFILEFRSVLAYFRSDSCNFPYGLVVHVSRILPPCTLRTS